MAVGAPAVYDKDGHKLRAEVGRNIAAGIFWAKTRYRSAPPSSTMSAAPPGGIKHDVKRIMRDEIPLQQHAHDLSHSRLEPERCAQAAGQSFDRRQPAVPVARHDREGGQFLVLPSLAAWSCYVAVPVRFRSTIC